MVHSVSRGFTFTRIVIAGFILVPVGSLRRAYWSSGPFLYAWVHSLALSGRHVHSGTRGFTFARLVVATSIRVGLGSLRRIGVSGFIRVRVGSLGRA